MGTIADKLTYLGETKDLIKQAIVAKGVEVPDGTPFRNYAALLDELGNVTNSETEEIMAELDTLLSETDAQWLETLGGYSIAEKIRFLQLCRGNILNSILNKGVDIPSSPPFRTIPTLIDAIEGEAAEYPATTGLDFTTWASGTFVETFEDESVKFHTVTFDDNGMVASVDGIEISNPTITVTGV